MVQLTKSLTSIITARIILEKYGSEINGLTQSILQILKYVSLLDAGSVIRFALYRGLANDDYDDVSSVLGASRIFYRKLGLVIITFTFAMALIFPHITDSTFTNEFVFWMVIILGFSKVLEYFIGIPNKQLLNAELKQYLMNFLNCILRVVNCIAIVFAVNTSIGIHGVKFVSSLIFAIAPILTAIYVRNKYTRINYRAKPNHQAIKDRWKAFGQQVAYFVNTNTDIVIITMSIGFGEVSVYSVYFVVINAIVSIISSVVNGTVNMIGRRIAKNEESHANKILDKLETIIFFGINVIFNSCLVLIVPFVSVYTKNVHDINYINYSFAAVVTFYGAIKILRSIYNGVINSAGHYKQLQKSSYVEPVLNITLTLILVNKMGITGVVLATIISTTFKTVYCIIYLKNNILYRNIDLLVKRVAVSLAMWLITFFIYYNYKELISVDTFVQWIVIAISVFIISCLVSAFVMMLCFEEDKQVVKELLKK